MFFVYLGFFVFVVYFWCGFFSFLVCGGFLFVFHLSVTCLIVYLVPCSAGAVFRGEMPIK